LLIDEGDDGDWSIADKSGEMSNVVEHLLAGCSQNSEAAKTFETGTFVFRQRGLQLMSHNTTSRAVPLRPPATDCEL
jgi:hypothetical protein